ncbi:hypothetical protein F8M41_016279 [Gigaspora margarita]|uniref:Uncharacterized protein n=1 Tax=Gigaspora margarita TaxID=4874 RepID=A0A8H4EUU9_GIGMA|nr:hypothetical protein F8M41_016279 [Gigaspora margarita]
MPDQESFCCRRWNHCWCHHWLVPSSLSSQVSLQVLLYAFLSFDFAIGVVITGKHNFAIACFFSYLDTNASLFSGAISPLELVLVKLLGSSFSDVILPLELSLLEVLESPFSGVILLLGSITKTIRAAVFEYVFVLDKGLT